MSSEQIRPVASFPDLTLAQVMVTQGESLPHWEASGAVYDIALHLADSVPAAQLSVWREKRAYFKTVMADPSTSATAREALLAEIREVYNDNVEKYLQAGYGECLLGRPGVAEAVAEVFEHDNGRVCALHALTIMPNHLHVVASGFGMPGGMKAIVDKWKRISAHAVNRLCDRRGEVWRRDAYTHIIRTREEYATRLKYVWHNPDMAGLTTGFWRKRYV